MNRDATYMLREFHEAFNQAIGETPRNHQLRNLRARLTRQESKELLDELNKVSPDPEKICKELCDVIYVAFGTGVAFGMDLEGALEEVHNSNMSKLGLDGKPIIDRYGKALKGPNYFEPDMRPFVPLTIEGSAED